MERLTVKCRDGVVRLSADATCDTAIDRLAAYEDTGLEPEEIVKYKAFADKAVTEGVTMGEIKRFIGGESENLPLTTGFSIRHLIDLGRAEKEGRLVVLPAATVYELMWDAGEGCDSICPASIDGIGCCSLCDHGELTVDEKKCRQSHVERLGKDVFLTREAAEAALKERGREP